jgi:hypothetical protein
VRVWVRVSGVTIRINFKVEYCMEYGQRPGGMYQQAFPRVRVRV